MELQYTHNPRVQERKAMLRRIAWAAWVTPAGANPEPNPELRHPGDTDTIDGFTFTLVVEEDDAAIGRDPGGDDQVLGTLTESPTMRSSWKVDPDFARGYYYHYHHYYVTTPELWWNPMEEIEQLQRHFSRAGASRQVAREFALENEKAMMERRLSYGEHWHYVTIGVKVSSNGVELGSAYVGNVESDFIENGYADDLIPDLVSEALNEAWARIREMTKLRGGRV